MGKVIASISQSVDGYITGPDDHAGQGLGRGGERLHYWVMGGPWTYEDEHELAMQGPDKEYYDELVSSIGVGIVGRGMYDGAGAWGGKNPFPGTLFVVTHRVEDQPPEEAGFTFISDLMDAIDQAQELAASKDVSIAGGADVIRQALAAGRVDELSLTTAPVILGGGKPLFDGFDQDLDLDVLQVVSSPWATHVRYAVRRRATG